MKIKSVDKFFKGPKGDPDVRLESPPGYGTYWEVYVMGVIMFFTLFLCVLAGFIVYYPDKFSYALVSVWIPVDWVSFVYMAIAALYIVGAMAWCVFICKTDVLVNPEDAYTILV